VNHDFQDSDPADNQPFPTLKQVLESVPLQCGFNVEIKYPQKKNDGSWDGPSRQELDENEFVDIILCTIMQHAGDRNIVLSTFHPDICILLRLKQNRFPVLFLTQGRTKRYLWFNDPRTCSVEMATFLAKTFQFWGVNAHAEDLLKDRALVKYVKRYELCLFTWGEDINSTNVIHQLKNDGVDGIIYDKYATSFKIPSLFAPSNNGFN
jgi:glycerophosphocholine phosphodiesterase GPCPD1